MVVALVIVALKNSEDVPHIDFGALLSIALSSPLPPLYPFLLHTKYIYSTIIARERKISLWVVFLKKCT